jgi:AcrR family transcriptional regulator
MHETPAANASEVRTGVPTGDGVSRSPVVGPLETRYGGADAPEGDAKAQGVRPPKQERSRRTLDRILAASLELFRQSGVEGTSVAGIVERAETSVGSFYARFAGKEELVHHLRERFRGEVLDRWDAGMRAVDWTALPMTVGVAEAVAALVQAFRADWKLSRVLDGGAGRPGEEGGWWVREFREHALSTLTPALLAGSDKMALRHPEWALEVGYRMASGAIRDAMEANSDDGAQGSPDLLEALAPELIRAWTAYLKADEPEPGATISGEGEVAAGSEVGVEPEAAEGREVGVEPEVAAVADFFDPWS